MPDDVILQRLQHELKEAKQSHELAKERFWKVSAQPQARTRYTAGIPEPDGSMMMRNVIREETFARQAHIAALVRLNEYLLNGTVPDDLKNKLKLTSAAKG